MRSITLVRHSEATHNRAAFEKGDRAYFDEAYADAELTHRGIWMARNLRKELWNYDYTCRQFDRVYCSPLRRCRQTLLELFPDAEHEVVVLDDRLMEPQGAHPCNRRAPLDDLQTVVPPGWNLAAVAARNPYSVQETNDDFKARVSSWAREGEKLLVVTHHDWIREFVRQLTGRQISVPNCRGVELIQGNDGAWIIRPHPLLGVGLAPLKGETAATVASATG